MQSGPLIEVNDAAMQLTNGKAVFADCRFTLTDTEAGRRAYQAAHIPGAVYAHLDEDLSGPIVSGKTGRHPLPAPEMFAAALSRWGIDSAKFVICYDAAGGDMAAARLWWMLRWVGHDRAAVLNGGWRAWQTAGLPEASGSETRAPAKFELRLRPELVVSAEEVQRRGKESCLIDARAAATFRGEGSSHDPVHGHIPGAVSAPRTSNTDEEGRFRPPSELHAYYRSLIGSAEGKDVIAYCGSGVTAAHDILALEYCGIHGARLYPGSWSEWIIDPRRPIQVEGSRPL